MMTIFVFTSALHFTRLEYTNSDILIMNKLSMAITSIVLKMMIRTELEDIAFKAALNDKNQ